MREYIVVGHADARPVTIRVWAQNPSHAVIMAKEQTGARSFTHSKVTPA